MSVSLCTRWKLQKTKGFLIFWCFQEVGKETNSMKQFNKILCKISAIFSQSTKAVMRSFLENLGNFTGKHLCWSLFSILACNFIKQRLQHRCFPVKFPKRLKTPFFTEHFQWPFLSLSGRYYFVGFKKWYSYAYDILMRWNSTKIYFLKTIVWKPLYSVSTFSGNLSILNSVKHLRSSFSRKQWTPFRF